MLLDAEDEGRCLSVWDALVVALTNLPLAPAIAELRLTVQAYSFSPPKFPSTLKLILYGENSLLAAPVAFCVFYLRLNFLQERKVWKTF